jgi:hypothetical protein
MTTETQTVGHVLKKYSPQQLRSLIHNLPENLKAEAAELIEDWVCSQNPLYWAQHCTKTENPKYLDQGLEFKSHFPRKTYFEHVFTAFSSHMRLFLPKTREMLTSWSAMVYATNRAQWHKAEVIVQTDSEDKAKQLVGYAECLYRNQEGWLKELHPLAREAANLSIEWKDGGKIFGIPKGEHKIRMFHPSLYILDEAAFLPEAEQCYNAAHPVCSQIIAISSAGPGWFADECTR